MIVRILKQSLLLSVVIFCILYVSLSLAESFSSGTLTYYTIGADNIDYITFESVGVCLLMLYVLSSYIVVLGHAIFHSKHDKLLDYPENRDRLIEFSKKLKEGEYKNERRR